MNRTRLTGLAVPQLALPAFAAAALAFAGPARAEPLVEQPLFDSTAGPLDLLMVAKPRTIGLAGLQTTAWVYEICRRPPNGADACPQDAPGTANAYGGTRLQLQPGDSLRIRLVNQLPALTCDDAKHAAPGDVGAELRRNPTNLHTHGLIVEPRRAAPGRPTYGDYVFVVVQNPANPQPPAPCPAPAAAAPPHAGHDPTPAGGHVHGSITDVAEGAVEYDIRLARNHPSGLFWFHPHNHGLALNQVSAGLAGSLTVGNVHDYVCDEPGCRGFSGRIPVRHMMLKDVQIEASGAMLTQQDPGFCDPDSAPGDPRQGVCAGSAGHPGGRWVHSINGQVYPEVAVGAAGEIWRISNASGSRSYALSVQEGGGARVVQVLSIDGVSLDVPRGTTLPQLRAMLGPKVDVVSCPNRPASQVPAIAGRGGAEAEPVCATGLRMMPSARMEILIGGTGGGLAGRLPVAQAPGQAVLRTAVYSTGDDPANAGDNWPRIDLAAVTFAPAAVSASAPGAGVVAAAPTALRVRSQKAAALLQPGGALVAAPTLLVPGADQPVGIASARGMARPDTPPPAGLTPAPTGGANAISAESALGLLPDPRCKALPAGHRRRVFFGKLAAGTDTFGLGYEEVDAKGAVMPGTEQPITMFNPDHPTVCIRLPLILPGRAGYQETWELVNLTNEDHNFHIHQTRFRLLGGGPSSPGTLPGGIVLQDNVPVLHGTSRPGAAGGCDGTVAAWRAPRGGGPAPCVSPAVVVRTPFSQVGDFVYHCHILEHEDGGMMARIRVVPALAIN